MSRGFTPPSSAAFRNLLLRREQALIAQALQSAACPASHPVEARLSRWLLRARDLCDSETLPMTQESLAQMIGVQRNAVSIFAHTLRQARIIRYSRGHIEITDVEALKATACECYGAVRVQYDRLLKIPALHSQVWERAFYSFFGRHTDTWGRQARSCDARSIANFSCQRRVGGSSCTSVSVH